VTRRPGQLHEWWLAHKSLVLAVAAIGLVAVIVALVWPVTDLLAAHDVGRMTGAQRAVHLQSARETARAQLLTLGAGLFAAGALLFTGRSYGLTRRISGLTAQAQVIEQLGSRKTELRMAAIYVLEKVTLDFPRDQPTVVEILAAFIRSHADDPRFALDVKAAVTVLGRRRPKWDRTPLDPKYPIDLGTADLSEAIFEPGVPAPKGWKNDKGQRHLTRDGIGKDQLSANTSGEDQ
jgi:hypothetical protein